MTRFCDLSLGPGKNEFKDYGEQVELHLEKMRAFLRTISQRPFLSAVSLGLF